MDKRAQGSTPHRPQRQSGAAYSLGLDREPGSRACVILRGPACGLESAKGQVDHNGRGGEGRAVG